VQYRAYNICIKMNQRCRNYIHILMRELGLITIYLVLKMVDFGVEIEKKKTLSNMLRKCYIKSG